MPGLRSDFRFLLPAHPRNAVVLGGLEGWASDLQRVGIDVASQPGASRPELVVAPRALARTTPAGSCGTMLVGSGIVAGVRGPQALALFPLGGVDSPGFVVPLRAPALARYAVEHNAPARTVPGRLRNELGWHALARGFVPPRRTTVTLVPAATPFLVEAASELGVPPGAGWMLLRGRGAEWTWEEKKGVFLLFESGDSRPRWVLKFPRLQGPSASLLAEEANLRSAVSAGPAVAAHLPRVLGRVLAEGFHASLEHAAPGVPLTVFLRSGASEPAKLEVLDAVCEWTVELAAGTAERRSAHDRGVTAERPVPDDATADLECQLMRVPVVLQHDDLWPRNIFADGDSFTVIDWGAAKHGWPLWDLLGFLMNAVPLLRGAGDERSHVRLLRDLFLGGSDLSPLLFRWIRRTVERLGLRGDDVARLVTLYVLDPRYRPWPRAAFAHEWSTAAGLGRNWSAWRR